MVTSLDEEGQLRVAADIVGTVTYHAHRHAELVAIALDATGLFLDKPVRLPPGFLFEFVAVLQLGVWEAQHITVHAEAGLPSYDEARRHLAARVLKGPAEFQDPTPTPLVSEVLQILVARFAWKGPRILNADILLDDCDDDDLFCDRLAEFLWTHRNELTNLVPDKRK
jgi:hypothetical protein